MRAALNALAAVLLASSLADAAESSAAVRIEFRGQVGCPDKDAFMSSVRARSQRVREAEPGERARAFEVTLSQKTAGGFHGELAVVDATVSGPAERARSIDGDSCEEVVEALALFTVLAVDPESILGANAEGAGLPPQPNGKPQANPESAHRPVDRPRASPPPEPPRDVERTSDYRGLAGLHGGALAVGVSTPLPAASLFTEFGSDDPEVGLRFAPSARVSVLITPETTIHAPVGVARLRWTMLALDLCPAVARASRPLAFRACFTASEGLLHAAGEIDEPESVTTPFPTLGALVRGEWAVLDRVLLELAFAIEFPLRRDSFYFEPSTLVYEVPAVVGLVTLGGGFRFL